jgi:hypothetical protein
MNFKTKYELQILITLEKLDNCDTPAYKMFLQGELDKLYVALGHIKYQSDKIDQELKRLEESND